MTTRLHGLDINNVDRAWTEKRTPFDETGVWEPYEVYVAICDCGVRFEGYSAREVTLKYRDHEQAARR